MNTCSGCTSKRCVTSAGAGVCSSMGSDSSVAGSVGNISITGSSVTGLTSKSGGAFVSANTGTGARDGGNTAGRKVVGMGATGRGSRMRVRRTGPLVRTVRTGCG